MGKFANDLLKFLQFDIFTYLHLHCDLLIICSASYICQYTRNLHVYIMTYVMYKIVIVWIYDDIDPTGKFKKTTRSGIHWDGRLTMKWNDVD